MAKTPISTDAAPDAIGPYSQAIRVGDWVFTAGQVGADPVSGELPESIEAQTVRALENIGGVLAAAGCEWSDVVKTTVFLADLGDYKAFNPVYAEFIGEPFPARSTIQVAGLPRGALVEIEAVAHLVS